ncbi:MAG TPA: hypothetical protein VGD07_17940 [Methylomirabilota bacterium]
MTRTFFAALVAAVCLAAPAAAQQPTQRQVDSLAAQLRALRARLDSILATLGRQPPPPGDDLAALRAAAAAATGRDTARADTAPQRFVGRERSQTQLNPEISVTGNLHGVVREGAQAENFELHEVEFSFQAALDPYSHTKIFAAVHEGEVDIEEGYFYYTGLPGRARLDLGVFRQQLGELNRWHLHAVPESDYPLALTTYAGEEGLAGAGLSLYRAFGGLGTHEVWAQVTAGTNEVLFEDGARPAYLVHLNNFWQLSRSTYMQIGATGVYGTNPDSSLKTTLGSVNFRFSWRPPARALYRDWTLRGELFGLKKERGGAGDVRLGGFIGTTYKLGQRWIAGARYDYVEAPPPEGPNEITRQVVPSLTWWQSEWVFLRAEFNHRLTPVAGGSRNRLVLQAVWAIGPHKHETY